MKSLCHLLVVVFTILSSTFAFGFEEKNLLGTWELVDWKFLNVPTAQGPMNLDFCMGSKISGILIYNKSGHMSAAINCDSETLPNSISKLSNDMMFYAGTYVLEKDGVVHSVLNSSFKPILGTNQLRKIEFLDENTLVLTGSTEVPTGRKDSPVMALQYRLSWIKASH